MQRLKNKVALVTGAAQGIGAAIAQAMVEQGATVVLSDLRADLVARTASGMGMPWMELDVRQEAQWEAAMTQLLSVHGCLHVVVNNAVITGLEGGAAHDPEHADLEHWRAVHATNLDGEFLGCKHALRAMRRLPDGHSGSIINLSSRSGLVGIPAAILTPMWDPILGDGPERAGIMAAMVADTPLRRFGTAQEVASVAVFLASDESAYVTGAELHVDGGILAGSAGSVQRLTAGGQARVFETRSVVL